MLNSEISELIVIRLTTYLRCLNVAKNEGKTIIRSEEIASLCGIKPSVVRKDLTQFGAFGIKGKGYDIDNLIKEIRKILGLEVDKNVILIGVGNLGTALLRYKGFTNASFKFLAGFDHSKQKIGKNINGIEILDINELPHFLQSNDVHIIILTIPSDAVLNVIKLIDFNKIEGILNFTPVILPVPKNKVYIKNIDLSRELETLSFCMKNCLEKEEK